MRKNIGNKEESKEWTIIVKRSYHYCNKRNSISCCLLLMAIEQQAAAAWSWAIEICNNNCIFYSYFYLPLHYTVSKPWSKHQLMQGNRQTSYAILSFPWMQKCSLMIRWSPLHLRPMCGASVPLLSGSVLVLQKVPSEGSYSQRRPLLGPSPGWKRLLPLAAFTFKTLLRHYAKRALTPRSLNVKLGPRHNYHKGRAAIRTFGWTFFEALLCTSQIWSQSAPLRCTNSSQ